MVSQEETSHCIWASDPSSWGPNQDGEESEELLRLSCNVKLASQIFVREIIVRDINRFTSSLVVCVPAEITGDWIL